MKEGYLIFNRPSTIDGAREDLAHIMELYIHSNIEEYRKFASTTLVNWLEEIINSFQLVNGRRISNDPIESTNSRVRTILKVANGFNNFSRMRNKIMYCLNKDALITVLKEKQLIKTKGKKRGKYNKQK